MSMSETDAQYMRRAIELARKAAGWTNPNPLVGAVIVKDGRIIGEGFHERYGELHAERNALASCTEDPAGATIYVTLEPCSHTGHQPPCADALIEAGIARVVVGSRDPNPLVSGRGNARLEAAGIRVETDFLKEECDKLNPIFFHYITTKTPYVVAKWAMTADGKIATETNDSKWVTGEIARADVHDIRHRLSGICVGLGTLESDDPMLTCRRDVASNNPIRVVCDSHLRISMGSNVVKTARDVRTIVACASPADSAASEEEFAQRASELEELGVEVVRVAGKNGKVDLRALMVELGARKIDSLLIEGGGELLASAFESEIVNEAVVYMAPKVVGGKKAKTPVMGDGIDVMSQAWNLGSPRVEQFGDDVKITYVKDPERGYACSPAL